ncbi:AAA-like domain-containing protein [Leptolyngbya sp. FACHB-711]|uniref:AAA-like domain-containing protein n=1 Tax=Leptolyngbya sp. FACHB-711 TaxID=2692813 RepID=UPI0016831215|nr:AAA-like domain-containing protein [Leptolyngbya sp. FACHB-711]MBD2022887.1 AAA-like domain-containing protein [Leptolyngbya sp. FACHB-711]
MAQQFQSSRRKRGVILSSRGWQRVQSAEQKSAEQDNGSRAYTLDQLSERTGLSPNTITKVRRRRLAVDRQTLEFYFSAVGLELTPEDYISLDPDTANVSRSQTPLQGQVPLDSPYYIERQPDEQIAYEEVLQPGALIRIKAPQQSGKTSLMTRILASARDKGMREAVVSLQLADSSVLTDFNRFLRWFCAVVTHSLHLPNRVDEYWNEVYGSSYNCTNYFERYLLTEIDNPIVLALDEGDILFKHPILANDFMAMVRAWNEKSRYGNDGSELWQQLRLVVIHSAESLVGLPFNLNHSPFNIGLSIELKNFNQEQVQELIQRYGINNHQRIAPDLMSFLGGIPYLIQLTLHHISNREVSFSQIKEEAISTNSIFSSHLRNLFAKLQQSYPQLIPLLQQVVNASEPIVLDPIDAFNLQCVGLIRSINLHVEPSCILYQQYFSQVLRRF